MQEIYDKEIPLGDGWVEVSGDWQQIDKNKILHEGNKNGKILDRLYINNAKASDGFVKAKIRILSDTGGERQAQLVFRYIDSQRYYFAEENFGGQSYIIHFA